MEKLSSNLLALNVGNVFALTHLEAAEVLSGVVSENGK